MKVLFDLFAVIALALFWLLVNTLAIGATLAPLVIVAYVVLWIFGWRA